MASSKSDRGPATAADFRDLADRLDVIADDIVLLTRERDEAQATVARVEALCTDAVARHYGTRYGAPSVGVAEICAAVLGAS